MFRVQVRNRLFGQPNVEIPNVALDLLHETLSVRDLITRTVTEQIQDLLLNHHWDEAKTRETLARQYLTDHEIAEQAEQGAVRVLPTKIGKIPNINTGEEVQKALTAFQKRIYLIVVDGYQPAELDEDLTLKPTSKITFLRLTPLVGG